MDNLFNSKPIHNVSLIDCRERNKQQPIMNSPKISKHSSNVITKSLKAFLKRLKGSNIRQETQAYVPNRDMLPFIIIEDGEDNTLVPSPSIYYKPKSKPVDLSSRDSSNIRHSLDLSTLYNFDSQQGYAVNDYEAISNRNGDRLKSAREDDLKKLRENALQGSLDEEIQRRLWNEDVTFCSKEKISEWLGTNSEPFRVQVLHLYMQNFDFKNKKLDEAFRMLCSKLYLKAESQQLDRILEAFAKRFHECNPTTLLHSVDVVHAVAYSLLLLNTDLHVVSNKGNRMTRSNFIKNTMETVQTLMFPQIQDRVTKFDSSDLYSYRKISPSMSSPSFGSFKSFLDDHDLQPSNGGILLQTLDVLKSNITWKSSKSNYCPLDESLTRTQRTWLLDIESLLKEMYNEVKAHRIDQAEIKSTNISQAIIQRSKTLPKSEHRKVLRRRRGHSVGTKNKPLPPIPHQKIETEFSQMPAHEHKQGIVMRKCVMEAADKKARNRQWQLCYLISSETELMMYRPILKSDSKGMRRKSMIFWHQSVCPSFSLQDIVNSETDEWQPDPNQPPLAAIPLNHCYATSLLPPGWNGQRPHVFRLETADGGLWMFETTDLYAVQAWVEAVNHAAALISKSPMQGAVCNIDYGWDCDKSTMMNHIAVWHPPTPCMIQSNLSLNEQYKELKSQIRELAQQLDQHRLLKPIIDKKSPASYRNQAIVNWDKKFHYVSNELTKLRCYRDVLKQKVTT